MTCRDLPAPVAAAPRRGRRSRPPLEQHVQACPLCAAQHRPLRRLLDGLALLAPAVPPADLADRIAGRGAPKPSGRRAAPRRRWPALVGLAAAACVLVALGVRTAGCPSLPWRSFGMTHAVVQVPEPEGEPTRPLRDSMAEAGTAVTALTSRTAERDHGSNRSRCCRCCPSPISSRWRPSPAPMAPLARSLRRGVGRPRPRGRLRPPGGRTVPSRPSHGASRSSRVAKNPG